MFQEERRNAEFPFTEQQFSLSTWEQAKQARACSVCDSSLGIPVPKLPTKCTPSRKTIRGRLHFLMPVSLRMLTSKGFSFLPTQTQSVCKSVTDITWISLKHSLCQTCCAHDCCLSLLACPQCTGAPPTIWWKAKTSQTPTVRSDRNLQGIWEFIRAILRKQFQKQR